MLTVKFGEKSYEFDLQEQLSSLTGTESMMVEDFLGGGWASFRAPANLTRSTIVIVWLAKRSAGEKTTLDQIAEIPGLVFGDALEIDGDADDPEDPATPPDRPLPETIESGSLNGGNGVAATTPETSGNSGQPLSAASTA